MYNRWFWPMLLTDYACFPFLQWPRIYFLSHMSHVARREIWMVGRRGMNRKGVSNSWWSGSIQFNLTSSNRSLVKSMRVLRELALPIPNKVSLNSRHDLDHPRGLICYRLSHLILEVVMNSGSDQNIKERLQVITMVMRWRRGAKQFYSYEPQSDEVQHCYVP